MPDTIGKYLQEKLREKSIKNGEAARFLNIAESTFRKYFAGEDLPISKLIGLSKLLNEDIIYEYYYEKEPLKAIHRRVIEKWENTIVALEIENARQAKTIEQLNEQISTQKELISSLKRELELILKK